MRKKSYKNETLFVVISTFVLVVILVVSNIYDKAVTNTLDKTLQFQIQPIASSFDMKTINALRQRTRVNPLFTSSGDSSASALFAPTPTEEPLPTAIPADIVASEEAAILP